MDRIEALIGDSRPPGSRENLHIAVNGERLDILLSAESGRNLRGLSPTWLLLAGSGPETDGLRACIAERSRLDRGGQLLPILAEQDDANSLGTTVVADVRPVGGEVHWQRFGLDFAETPAELDENVQWLDSPGPFHFDRREYLDCLEAFTHCQPPAARPALKPGQKWPFFYRLFAIFGGLVCNVGSGALNLPALAYRQTQNELTESPAPPE
ncbi:MAG: hypothetical protein LBV79_05950, partial [Candidatus Adiutrix sp.]|nr:hypothetical protein [Candidatus Adiutrix sp.]